MEHDYHFQIANEETGAMIPQASYSLVGNLGLSHSWLILGPIAEKLTKEI